MKDVEYAYAVAYIKTLENKMLTPSDVEALITAPDAGAVMHRLHERGYEGDTAEKLLVNEKKRAWGAAYEVCPPEAPIEILLFENDFHNLKTILKAQISGTDWTDMVIEPSIIKPQTIAAAMRDNDFSQLDEFLRDTAKQAYQLLTSTMDAQLAEIFIDKQLHLAIMSWARAEKDEFLIGYAELLCTIANLKTAWRCMIMRKPKSFLEDALIPTDDKLCDALMVAEDTDQIKAAILSEFDTADVSSVRAFERWCDNKKLAYMRAVKWQCFGFWPIAAFLVGKQYEIQTLRIILSCKKHGVDEQVIRERLRDSYV